MQAVSATEMPVRRPETEIIIRCPLFSDVLLEIDFTRFIDGRGNNTNIDKSIGREEHYLQAE